MAWRKREHAIDGADLAVQLGLLCLGLVVLVIGGIGLTKAFRVAGDLAGSLAFTGTGVLVLAFVARTLQRKSAEARSRPPFRPPGWTPPVFPGAPVSGTPFPMFSAAANILSPVHLWTAESILTALGEIDWYQFERLCAALLRNEGYDVVRKGGARPDGGVDLIADRGSERIFVQCKHWRTRVVKEAVIQDLLNGMAQFEATRGVIYTLHGWATSAAEAAQKHAITLVDGGELAAQALARLMTQQLNEILNPELHHCPNCEAPWSGTRARSARSGAAPPTPAATARSSTPERGRQKAVSDKLSAVRGAAGSAMAVQLSGVGLWLRAEGLQPSVSIQIPCLRSPASRVGQEAQGRRAREG